MTDVSSRTSSTDSCALSNCFARSDEFLLRFPISHDITKYMLIEADFKKRRASGVSGFEMIAYIQIRFKIDHDKTR